MGSWVLDIKVITATGVFVPSFRMPAGICLTIDYTTTTVKALSYDNSVVWDETLNLTSVPHSKLTIELRAAFESDTMVGRGELIRKIETSSDYLLSHGDDPFNIPFLADANDRLQNVPVLTLKVSFPMVPTSTAMYYALLDPTSALSDFIDNFETISADFHTDRAALDSIFKHSASALPDFVDKFETISEDFNTDRAPLDSIVKHSAHIFTPQLFKSDGTIAQDTDDGHAHFAKYMAGHRDSYLKHALECFEQALQKCPKGHDARAAALSNLGWARLTAVVHNHSEDVHSIIPLFRENLELRPWDHPDHALSLFYLAHALNLLYEIEELDINIWESVALFFMFLHRSPVGTHMRHSVVTGRVLDDVIRKCNDLPIFRSEDDILLRRVAFTLCPSGTDRRARTLEMLSRTLCAHGGIDAIEESIHHRRDLVSMHPVGHTDRYITLNCLAYSLNCRFTVTGDSGDLEELIDLCKESLSLYAVRSNEEDVAALLNSLGLTLALRFEKELNIEDINSAIIVLRSARELCPNDEERLHSLGFALLARHTRADLKEAIHLWRQSRVLQDPENPERAAVVDALHWAFSTRFRRVAKQGELDVRIMIREDAAFVRWLERI